MAATSGAVLNGLGSPFLRGSSRTRTLLAGARGGVNVVSSSKLVVIAAAQPKKSWIPGVRGGGNLVDPEWLDGSYVSFTFFKLAHCLVIVLNLQLEDRILVQV